MSDSEYYVEAINLIEDTIKSHGFTTLKVANNNELYILPDRKRNTPVFSVNSITEILKKGGKKKEVEEYIVERLKSFL